MSILKRFVKKALEADAEVVEINTIDECLEYVLEILQGEGVKRVAVQESQVTHRIYNRLKEAGYEVLIPNQDRDASINSLSLIDACIYAADLGIAETGTVIIATWSEVMRLATALPLLNIILLDRRNLVDSILSVEKPVRDFIHNGYAVSFITGPSKTGDIELKMVKGVHGPHRVVVILYGS